MRNASACQISPSLNPDKPWIQANDWNTFPHMVIWEVTRRCALSCNHCRANASMRSNPEELSFVEGLRLIDQIVELQPKLFVLSGGDPLTRFDLLDLVSYATNHGLNVALSPSATPLSAKTDWKRFAEAGLRRISFSLDGASRETHDRFRGVKGTWNWTMTSLENAHEAGLGIQINTTFSRRNLQELDDFIGLMNEINPAVWSVFMLIPTGRAQQADSLSGMEMEHLFNRLAEVDQTSNYRIKTTEGPHYRRVAWQRWMKEGGRRPMTLGLNDGRGFVFVSHTGEIHPSGFVPLQCGDVRKDKLYRIYRYHPVFKRLRDSEQLTGKCGRCEFRDLCGGSRARAYAFTGDYLAQEPCCIYQPQETFSQKDIAWSI